MPTNYNPKDNDEQLIAGCRVQHSLAQKYLYERYFGRLVGIAYRYARDKQEGVGILNQAFLKIFQSLDRFDGSNLLAWMRTIVFRTAINHVRGQIDFKNIDDFESDENLQCVENEALADLDIDYILKAIHQLPAATRTVFNLFEIEGLSHAEIAETLQISLSTSKWHVSEAKTKLRKILKNESQLVEISPKTK
jgi:RNA polymerase sigma factor (sigma-70 family)